MNRRGSGRTKGQGGPLIQKLPQRRYAEGLGRVLRDARAAWQVLSSGGAAASWEFGVMRWAKPLLISTAGMSLLAAASADVNGPVPLAWRWVESTPVSPSGSPLVIGERVYVAVGGRVYCLDKATGNQIWRFPVGAPLEANFRLGLKQVGSNILAASDDNSVFHLNGQSGSIVWQYQSLDGISGAPVATDSGVVVPLSGSKLMALSLTDGTPLYAKPYDVVGGLNPRLTPYQSSVITTSRNGEMISMDVITQQTVWRRRFTRLDPLTEPTQFGDGLYLNTSGFVMSMAASTGAIRWRTAIGRDLAFAPAVSANGVIAVTRFGELYSLTSRGGRVFQQGVNLEAGPIAAPSLAGSSAIVPLNNGSVVLVNTQTGEVTWNYSIPVFKGARTASASGGPAGGAGGFGGPGDDTGDPGAGPGGFGPPAGGGRIGPAGGQGAGGAQQGPQSPFVPAAGAAVVAGDTMLLLIRDGSLISFDAENGVDLTPPTAEVLFPGQGAIIAGKVPMEMVFRLTDIGCGVNPETVQLTVNGEPAVISVTREGIVRFKVVARGTNRPLSDGRTEFVLSASDWLGNTSSKSFAFLIDNTLPPLGGPKPATTNQAGGGGFGNGGGRPGDGG